MADLTVTDRASTPTGLDITNVNAFAVDVFVSQLTGDVGATPFVVQGGLILAGVTAPIDVPKGTYFVWGYNTGYPQGNYTPFYMAVVTDGADPIATRSRQLIADRIRLLGLPLFIYEQWNTVDLTNVNYPCLILTTEGVQETREKSFNQTDDIGRPVRVQLCDRETTAEHRKLVQWELWRERIERAFHNQQLPMNESYLCRVEFGTITDRDLPHNQFMLSEFVIRHITRQYRGLGV